jgi:hypothetical protein
VARHHCHLLLLLLLQVQSLALAAAVLPAAATAAAAGSPSLQLWLHCCCCCWICRQLLHCLPLPAAGLLLWTLQQVPAWSAAAAAAAAALPAAALSQPGLHLKMVQVVAALQTTLLPVLKPDLQPAQCYESDTQCFAKVWALKMHHVSALIGAKAGLSAWLHPDDSRKSQGHKTFKEQRLVGIEYPQ